MVKLITIFFDLGGVLLNFSHDKMFQNIADLCQIDENYVRKEFLENGLSLKYESGKITSKDLHLHFSQISSKNLSYQDFLRAGSDIFSLKTDVISLLPILKNSGKKLILLSNTCEAHFSWIQSHYDFLNFFDDFVLSYEIKSMKPEKKIFFSALAKAKTPVQSCFYIDDILENILAAQKIGIDSHHFQGVEQLIQALQQRGCL